MLSWLKDPWPWWVAGPLIGLMVPLLLLSGNKRLGVSSSLRHICAACLPAKIPFFQYNWKNESWNLLFVAGIVIGGWIAATFLTSSQPILIDQRLAASLSQAGIHAQNKLLPEAIFSWQNLLTVQGIVFMILGGFLVGFGTRYAGGCTSGHSIMGLSTLQWPSLIATICFMTGGFIVVNLVVPHLLNK